MTALALDQAILKRDPSISNSVNSGDIFNENCLPYYPQSGYPLIGFTGKLSESVTIDTLKKMGLSFYEAWAKKDYHHLETLLNLPCLTRLQGVVQMQVFYTSSGSNHTNSRFYHSLYVAQQVYKTINTINEQSKGDKRFSKIDVRDLQHCIVAGLLHDLAHGPFSHVFEKVYPIFRSGEFNHDKELRERVKNDPNLRAAIRGLDVLTSRVLNILDKRQVKTNHLHYLVKVLCDRIAYIQTDGFSADFSREEKTQILDTSEKIKNSMRIVLDGQQATLCFLPEGATALKKFLNFRKEIFVRYCLSPESLLVAAMIGNGIKQLADNYNSDRKELADQLSRLSDDEFIERLSTNNPKLSLRFSRAKGSRENIDDYFIGVVDYKLSDKERFDDTLISSEFRKKLRAELHERFDFPPDDVFITFPLDDLRFYERFNYFDPKTNTISSEDFSYKIPDSDITFSIWLAIDHIGGSSNRERIQIHKFLELRDYVEGFIKNYISGDAGNIK